MAENEITADFSGEYGKNLMLLAAEARKRAYCPYSGFAVGAALLCRDGEIYTGCNIENAAYTPTVCAERVALFRAVSDGKREFSAIAIVGGEKDGVSPFCAPCGVCRQALAEFCGGELRLLLGTPEDYRVFRFDELLPFAFSPADLGAKTPEKQN